MRSIRVTVVSWLRQASLRLTATGPRSTIESTRAAPFARGPPLHLLPHILNCMKSGRPAAS